MSVEPVALPGAADGARDPVRLRHAPGARRQPVAHRKPARRAVDRPRLVAPLVECPQRLAVLAAPAGFGKSTLLAQWRRADPRPFAIVAISPEHDDPAALLDALRPALIGLLPAAAVVSEEGGVDGVLPAVRALRPSVLALDGLDALRSEQAAAVVARLADHMPARSTLVCASRRDPGLPLGRRRAQDDVVELRADRLAMTRAESGEAVRAIEPGLTDRQVDRLFELTGGWPAALRLAARAVAEQGRPAAADALTGADTIVRDYVGEEVLAALSESDRAFLRGISVVEPLTATGCDVALDRRRSADDLRRLLRAGVPLVPDDRTGTRYRLNPLLAQALRADLHDVEPDLAAVLHRRVSAWHERQGDVELAIEHAVSAGDVERAGELLGLRSAGFAADGRAGRLDDWLRRLGDRHAERHPALALSAAVSRLFAGDRDAADRWAARVLDTGRDGRPDGSVRAGALLVRATVGRDGVGRMAADALEAQAATPTHGAWRALACLTAGSAAALGDDVDGATGLLDEGARAASFDAPLIRSLCLAELAFLALERGEMDEAVALAGRARSAIDRSAGADVPLATLTFAVGALVHARRGRLDAAAADLLEATARLDALPDPPAWYGALVRVVLARVELKLSDAGAGRRALAEAARLRRHVPGAVALERWLDAAWALADDYAAGPVACPTTLTMAELRVLRLLPSHLTFREIGARLHVSANTVKTQAHAVYRKLDARSRSQAVAHASAIGLIDPPVGRAG